MTDAPPPMKIKTGRPKKIGGKPVVQRKPKPSRRGLDMLARARANGIIA